MKTRCPVCQTTFRVTPGQIKARAGKVRCSQCQSVFNALDSLVDEEDGQPSSPPVVESDSGSAVPTFDEARLEPGLPPAEAQAPDESPAVDPATAEGEALVSAPHDPILPRQTSEIPGYSKWAEGVVASSPFVMPEERSARWPFVLAALLLSLTLAGQAAFHLRSELAVALPSLRPSLESFAAYFGAAIPLPRHAELLGIETSDLQSDPARGNLLVLNATLRNRAAYAQAYPSLELSLTDTQDQAIVRKVFSPAEYLPAKLAGSPAFAANSDLAVRLWLEARDVGAAGYRLYLFYQ